MSKDKVALNDELLDKVSGGQSLGGSAEGPVCPYCGYPGPHAARLNYERVGNEITLGNTEVYCGQCNAKLQ